MNNQSFRANMRNQSDTVTLDLYGEINSFAEADLNAAYTEAEILNHPRILLNFTGVHYINSTGIALIVGLLARARKTHRQIIVFGLSDHYMEIFQITRLVDFMTVYEDEATALQSLKPVNEWSRHES